jgi:hypothetical protein
LLDDVAVKGGWVERRGRDATHAPNVNREAVAPCGVIGVIRVVADALIPAIVGIDNVKAFATRGMRDDHCRMHSAVISSAPIRPDQLDNVAPCGVIPRNLYTALLTVICVVVAT